MKRSLNKILLIILSFVIMLSVSACGLFAPTDPSGGVNGGSGAGGGQQTPQTNFTVEFNTQEQRVNDRLAAINKVKRANVAITVKAEEGEYWGSGTIIDVDLKDENDNLLDQTNEFYILTCAHVIDAQGEITVYVPDRNARNYNDADYDTRFAFSGVLDGAVHSEQAVRLVGSDPTTDIAVLELDIAGSGVSAADIVEVQLPVESYTQTYGEEIFAIGNAGGTMPMSISDGIISYLERTENFEGTVLNVMQITAHATHGNSGGGVYNYYGELIGMVNGGNETYLTRNAIPFKTLYTQGEDTGFKNIAKQLIETRTSTNFGYVSGRWNLGVMVEERLSGTNVALTVVSVTPNSNAHLAGVQIGDVIVGIKYYNGESTVNTTVTTNATLGAALTEVRKHYSIGQTFNLRIVRSGGTREIAIKLEKQFIYSDTGM